MSPASAPAGMRRHAIADCRSDAVIHARDQANERSDCGVVLAGEHAVEQEVLAGGGDQVVDRVPPLGRSVRADIFDVIATGDAEVIPSADLRATEASQAVLIVKASFMELTIDDGSGPAGLAGFERMAQRLARLPRTDEAGRKRRQGSLKPTGMSDGESRRPRHLLSAALRFFSPNDVEVVPK
jgi:hypothetical protein